MLSYMSITSRVYACKFIKIKTTCEEVYELQIEEDGQYPQFKNGQSLAATKLVVT